MNKKEQEEWKLQETLSVILEATKNRTRKVKLFKFRGCANVCKECGENGAYGTIVKYLANKKWEYQLCGHCGHIEKMIRHKKKIQEIDFERALKEIDKMVGGLQDE